MSKENGENPTGICRRIFYFLKDEVVARGIKRVYLGNTQFQPKDDQLLLPRSRAPDDSTFHVPIDFKVADIENILVPHPANSAQVNQRDERNPMNFPATIGLLTDKNGRLAQKLPPISEGGAEDNSNVESIREGQTTPKPIGRKPINLIAHNINERSEKFIRKKEEMMKNHLNMEFKDS